MKNKIFIGLIIALVVSSFILKGCTTAKPVVTSQGACKNVPEVWWGNRGENPSNNVVWKCYDWIILKQKDF